MEASLRRLLVQWRVGTFKTSVGVKTRRIFGISLCERLPLHVAVRQAEAVERLLKGARYGAIKIRKEILDGDKRPLSPGRLICP